VLREASNVFDGLQKFARLKEGKKKKRRCAKALVAKLPTKSVQGLVIREGEGGRIFSLPP